MSTPRLDEKPAGADAIHAPPIFLLVLGSLSAGLGFWWLVNRPVYWLGVLVALGLGIVLFAAAGLIMRRSGIIATTLGKKNE